jgi:hypothetical protein
MDPNANLQEQRRILAELGAAGLSQDGQAQIASLANQLIELIDELDTWVANGGFLPAEWAR